MPAEVEESQLPQGPLLLVEAAAPPPGEVGGEGAGAEVAAAEVEVSQPLQGSKEITGADLLGAESEDEAALAEAEAPVLQQLQQQLQ